MKLLVINLDDLQGPGTHWCGLIEFPKSFEYFDSYGLDCPTEVTKHIGSKPLYYQNDVMQSLSSDTCGWFVIYWAWLRLIKKHKKSIVEPEYINEDSIKTFRAIVNGNKQ